MASTATAEPLDRYTIETGDDSVVFEFDRSCTPGSMKIDLTAPPISTPTSRARERVVQLIRRLESDHLSYQQVLAELRELADELAPTAQLMEPTNPFLNIGNIYWPSAPPSIAKAFHTHDALQELIDFYRDEPFNSGWASK